MMFYVAIPINLENILDLLRKMLRQFSETGAAVKTMSVPYNIDFILKLIGISNFKMTNYNIHGSQCKRSTTAPIIELH